MRARWLAVIALCLVATTAEAGVHLIKVVEVFPGTPAAPNAQYVVLQMYNGGQNNTNGTSLTVVNGANQAAGTFTFTANVATSANQTKVLIATAEAQAFFGVTPDLVMTPILPKDGGKICFVNFDCMAYGNYNIVDATVGTPFNGTAMPVAGQPNRGLVVGKAVKRRLDISGGATTLEELDDTGNSANDFAFGSPAPKNSTGVTGTIPAATCGNSTLEGLETCEDTDQTSGDGCSATCVDEFCGDVVMNDTTETCDDGNTVNGDGCDNNCKLTGCGNGIPTAGEACDDGNPVNGDGCDNNCKATACGNGIVTTGETCDDGDLDSGDGCDANCTVTGCGNGIVTAGEACEPPNAGTCSATCQITCSLPAECADSDPCTSNETCTNSQCVVSPTPTDDNEPCTVDSCGPSGVLHDPLANGTTCTSGICVAGVCGATRCGDGFHDVMTTEQCDDGNTVDTDDCTNACTTPACGDGVVQSTEQCDDHNLADNDGCSAACMTEVCGDMLVQSNEQCDDGNILSSDGCSAACKLESCGDGVEQFGEQCDDGNTVDGDGCESCKLVEVQLEPDPDSNGGCCNTSRSPAGPLALAAFAGAFAFRRRRR